MGFSKQFDSLTQKGKKECLKLTVLQENSFNFYLSFYLLLKFSNYEHNCQPQVLCKILQRKSLSQVSFDHDFLKIHWLTESKVYSIEAH